ncbi:MAG: FKBP-type peptidyl-prolyl cis-trans isomerase [Chitinophagaceae bacterium]|nr:FKBP-type peptidyl-prolyl cis-trans isomerase [Chitinophagaceae bacterium]
MKASYTNDANAAQNTAMVAFCTTNNITYSTHPSGILYQIITPGAASKPNLCETISMTYTGTLLNGTKFDAGTISYPLSQLIVGWQITVPLIGKGGRIKVVLPSSLGYGAQTTGPIPANSPLYFDITLN